jgi:putative transposase
MIDHGHDLPLGRQAALLGLSRSTLYYEPRPVLPGELAIMRRIDELHLAYPFAGSRMLRDLLRGEGVVVGRELVATLMRRMGRGWPKVPAAKPLERPDEGRGDLPQAKHIEGGAGA